MNIFIAMSLAAAVLNLVSATLLIGAAINVLKVVRINAEIAKQLRNRSADQA